MNLKLFILTISLIQYNFIYVDCKINQTAYLNYLTNVIDHMFIQNGWMSMKNLYFDSIRNLSDPDLIMQKFDRYNILGIFYNIVQNLNYRYNEILLRFVELLNINVDICLNFFEANLMDKFSYCSFLLEKAIKNSLIMFESLYNAITFISYIYFNLKHFKFDILDLQNNLFAAVDDIYEIKNHKYLKIIRNEHLYGSIQEFLDIKEFIDDVYKIANNFFENNKSIINNAEKVNVKVICEMEYSSYINDFPSFVSFMYHKINLFYTETIKNNYEDLGFIQLINPIDHKFKPPKDKTINQELGITILNSLFNEGNWASFSQIDIKFDDLKISAKHVIRDLATDHNFHLKKHYFTQMVRCRFFEVLLNYNTLLSALKQLCITLKNENNYVKCVTCLFDAINDTVTMFDFMLTIIEKIKLSSIWQPNKSYSDLQSTHKLIYNYVVELRTKNVLRDKFVNNPEVNIEKLADDYIKNVENTRYKFIKMLNTLKNPKRNRCFLDGLLINKKNVVIKFQENANIINKRSDETHVTEYELITKYLYNFCKKFVKTDYVDTGFHKIHQNYFWQWI
ncbi:uncharacterized protein LOC126907596 [Daktulosphaira vitifoliae]|uniref:uncharacterized protein LOC126907596 n=1 Tax=Daktulosphaira vitifoliae TaxID=58002 RepID=UPI0021A9BCD7|nr:uncharacterized protein LOC126907596 [Daktulosphaira vitifoliae]